MEIRILALALAAALALSALAVAGCTGTTGQDPTALEGVTWVVTEMQAEEGALEPPLDAAPTVQFDGESMGGNATINQFSAQYSAGEDGAMEIAPGPMTLMAGPPELMDQETRFLELLGQTTSYAVTAESLEFSNAEGDVLMRFGPIEARPLTGTTWNATMYNTGTQAVTSVIADSKITAEFGDDGTLSGSAGVNTYSTGYEAGEDGSLAIEAAIATTMMAGPDELMQQEQAYLAALPLTTRYEIVGDTLTLFGGDDGTSKVAEYTAAD